MSNLIRRAILAIVLIAGIAPAIAAAPPPVPALPDTERRTSYSITASTCACAVNMALYGDSTDYQNWIEVWINGAQVAFNDPTFGWTITSPTGPLANIPRPVTDGVLTFTSPQTGVVQIVGARRPRRVSQFSENAGVSARSINQVVTDIVAMLREVWDKINDVTGRVVRAPAGETLATLPPAADRASMGACFDSGGNLAPCLGAPSGSFVPGGGITFTGTGPTTISTPTFVAGNGISFTGSNPTVISAGGASNGALFLPSRAAAALLDLHTAGVVSTGGYASPGDGGGATFKNVGSAPFIDSFIPAGNLPIPTGGSSYTNGTYFGVPLAGGTGSGAIAMIVVSGGIVTSVIITGTGGNGYTVGDILTTAATNIGGTGGGFTAQVSSVTVPKGSFTDASGKHFQIIPDAGNSLNVLQFGAAGNFLEATGEAGATNDQPAIQAALNYAAAGNGTIDAGGVSGTTILVPGGRGFLVCNGLLVPGGVNFYGHSQTGTLLKECTTDGSIHFITLGDPQTHQTAFMTNIHDMTLFGGGSATTANGFAMIYSRSDQSGEAVKNVAIYSTNRMCIKYEIGDGGVSAFGIHNVYCVPNGQTSPQVAMDLSGSFGFFVGDGTFFSVGGPQWTGSAISIGNGGTVEIAGVHYENLTTAIAYDGTVSQPALLNVHDNIGQVALTNFVVIKNGSVPGNVLISTFAPNGTACSVIKASACVAVGKIVAPTAF
jgi:hypothetical protein